MVLQGVELNAIMRGLKMGFTVRTISGGNRQTIKMAACQHAPGTLPKLII